MGFKAYLIFLGALAVSTHNSHGCDMVGVSNWLLPQQIPILDVFRGELFSAQTTSITGINQVTINQNLNKGPYFDITHSNSQFSIKTNDAFAEYEEYETETSISATVTFNCAGGNTRPLVFLISIQDTNNNDPIFMPSAELEFTVTPPLPPGFKITGCWDNIIVRDIDLTTQRVDFEIFNSNNPYFQIAYDEVSSTEPKQFKATLTTTTFIRSIPEPIEFTISATDVDLTNDPRRTTRATVRIKSDGEFDLPDEPVFSQTFYLATYKEDHSVALQDKISLSQGYHADVKFSIGQEYTEFFALVTNGNEISISVIKQLPTELLVLSQILLVVNAERDNTSGASATVVLQLPEEVALKFQQPIYIGSIVDNVLQLPELVLSQGYEVNPLSVQILSDYASYFAATVNQDRISITMSPLPASVIEQNNFLNLQVVASSPRTEATTIITLQIVKDDIVTPMFQRALYEGTYDSANGLTLEQIVIVQGYDSTVQVVLQGEHAAHFQLVQDGPNFSLTTTSLPTQIFAQRNLLLTLAATKPRTVGANTAISIALPAETQLDFQQQSYKGVIEDNSLQVPQLILSQGYDSEPVSVRILPGSAHASYFSVAIQNNIITISMSPLPANIIQTNNFLNLQVVASTERSSATAIVTLEIIKDDQVTPVFQRTLYEGSYDTVSGLALDQIVLDQGYDETVQITLQGEHANFFSLTQEGPLINLDVTFIPPALFQERTLLLSVAATKPRTVGANAAISISLPTDRELKFAAETYTGTIRDNVLTLETIVLSVGYASDVSFTLSGDHESYFEIKRIENEVSIVLRNDASITTDSNFLLLTVSASALNAITTSTNILLNVIREDKVTPRFNQEIFAVNYRDNSIELDGPIILSQGFDNTVSFRLIGEFSQYFGITSTGNNVALTLQSPIPRQVIFDEKVLTFSILAEKELTVGAVAAVTVRFPTELTHPTALKFSKNIYLGSLEQNNLSLDNVILANGITSTTTFELSGEYSSHFAITRTNDVISIEALSTLPPEVQDNEFITLELKADDVRAVPVTTAIVVDIVQPQKVIPPVFEKAYYSGVYTADNELHFEETITLSEGYDSTVLFNLEGEFTSSFELLHTGNVLAVVINSPIPSDVVDNNAFIILTIEAIKPGARNGKTVIVIDLARDVTDHDFLGFERINYVGSIVGTSVNLDTITLSEGFTSAVSFALHGDLASYFTPLAQGASVTISLNQPIPQESIPSNGVIVLELRATSPTQALPAHATIVLEVVQDAVNPPIPSPVFAEPFYIGSYSVNGNLEFKPVITLAEGYDPLVEFALEGEHAQWFGFTRSENAVSLVVSSAIPSAVIANNQQLIFTIIAQRPGSTTARATIVILLEDEINTNEFLGFERINYVGSLDGNSVNLDTITLSEGFTPAVSFTLLGDLASYFGSSAQGASVTISLRQPIPQESIPLNGVIVLELRATSPTQALPAHATIVLEVIQDAVNPPIPSPVFAEPFYVGSYSVNGNFDFKPSISLAEGYDPMVQFALEGEHAQWFGITRSENAVSLVVSSAIPSAVIANNQQLIFTIIAQRAGSTTARAAIVILLEDELNDNEFLGFERINYVGSLVGTSVNLDTITLSEGFTPAVSFALLGDLASYFSPLAQGASVTISLNQPIPQESIPSNGVIVLEIRATSPTQALPAHATIVLEVIQDAVNPPIPSPVFAEPFYVGSYSVNGNLKFEPVISLAEGYDPLVEFALEGEHAQWFGITRSENAVSLVVSSAIPSAVIANNQQLLFTIAAQRPGSTTARATIVILLEDEINSNEFLGFERINYVGSLDGNSVNLDTITLSEGFTPAVSFTLLGDLASFFSSSAQGASVTISLRQPIPQESIPLNGVIVLELRATSPTQALPAHATIVLEVVQDAINPPLPSPVFSEPFYVGSYSVNGNLEFEPVISLTEGYDPLIEFALEGEHAQWFGFTRSENAVSLVVSSAIPSAVIANNQQLLFTITAQRPGRTTARATIVILLEDEINSNEFLGFERINYVGSLDGNSVNLDTITLSEGFTPAVSFTLLGDLASYFGSSAQGASVTISLRQPIPQESIPSNGVIVLELRATSPTQALPAHATIVLEVVQDAVNPPIPSPVFAEPFYVGSYSVNGNFDFKPVISLAEGYDPMVQFALEGEHAQWFGITRSENAVSLVVSSAIPSAVIANNQQLLFTITAQRAGSTTARAAIVILLEDELNDNEFLGFERINYVGSLVGTSVNLDTITLSEGFTPAVSFALLGDLASYFSPLAQGASVTISLNQPIPQESIPSNGVIVLELRATSPTQALPAHATIVLEVIQDAVNPPIPSPVFAEPFYVGSYSVNGNLKFEPVISLAEGYDPLVEFALEGDHAQWFGITRSENAVSLVVSSAIPSAVIANNQQLLFTIAAQRPGSTTARATIVILLEDEINSNEFLGFERINYVGSLDGNSVNLDTITLSEGFTPAVSFTLLGDLASFFSSSAQGASVTISLRQPIPQESIPLNGVIVLELRATSPTQALPAHATIVLEVVQDAVNPSIPSPVFAEPFYVGSYTVNGNLEFEPVISLAEGYDPLIEFALEGDHAQWFGFTRSENAVSLVVSSAIPSAVIANNQQLLFTIAAQRPGSTTARATIVILLEDEINSNEFLGFERINYVGSLDGNSVILDTITLSEGFTPAVSFTLLGDLKSYFRLSAQGASVTISMSQPIPQETIPSNGIIVLELRATSPTQALPAHATIVLHIIQDAVNPPLLTELKFDQTYYIGTYSLNNVLVFDKPIILIEGFDENVEFTFTGDHAPYFYLTSTGNSVSVGVFQSLPPNLIADNQKIVLVLTASNTGSRTTQATIIIMLERGVSSVNFDKVLYEGTIEGGTVQHETIGVSGYEGSNINIVGEYASLFGASVSDGTAVIQATGPLTLPADVRHVILELRLADSGAVLVLQLAPTEIIGNNFLGFERVNYVGSIVGNSVNLDTITLSEGFTPAVSFALLGDLASYFTPLAQGASVTISLNQPIPQESIPSNGVIVLEIRATSPTQALPAHATIVLEVVQDAVNPPIPSPVFAEPFYVGSYSVNGNFEFEPVITLAEGYDPLIEFALEGDHAQWFGITRSENAVSLVISSAIPSAVIANNQQLLFTITAQRPGSTTARATIVILMEDEISSNEFLGFERINYVGSIVGNSVNLDTITLSEGFTPAVSFSLLGDLASYFTPLAQGASVTISLNQPIPQESIPSNGVIVLEIRATSPTQALPAHATIVLEVVQDAVNPPIPSPVFAEPFYVGSYSVNGNFEFEPVITLAEGYDPLIEFALEGDHAQWFGITRSENAVSLVVSSAIPSAVIANNHQLLFTITAQRPGSTTARATIVILMEDEISSNEFLGFERINYVGSMVGNSVNLDTITLSEGFTPAVSFALLGDLSSYFTPLAQGASVTISLNQPIPQESIPSNGVIVLEIRATSPTQALPAHATIVLEVVQDAVNPPIPSPVFAEPFYVGSYSVNGNFEFEPVITLAEGYDPLIEFALEGDHAQWFGITRSENAVSLVISSAIPSAVIANNQQLLFTITAQRPGSTTARATIVILMEDEISSNEFLGFERINYVGSIVGNSVNLDTITLSEGFTPAVSFSLLGDLASYFTPLAQGASVTISLNQPIPQESIPSNGVIVLEIRATSPTQALPAHATIVLEVVQDAVNPPIPSPVFAEPFYIGSYSVNGNFEFEPVITLAEGYDPLIEFALEGEHAQWFGITRSENAVSLVVSSTIPSAVIANNQQLLFTITAQRPGSVTATATIIILLEDVINSNEFLGFEHINYVGSIVENSVNLDTITLSEGFTPAVSFTLLGDLAIFFSPVAQGASVTISLSQPIPQESLPSNGVIVLELRATSPTQALPAHATIVLNIVHNAVDPPLLAELKFDQTYYIGTYTLNNLLVLNKPITLIDGFDVNVDFSLTGDHASYFHLSSTGNSVSIEVYQSLPANLIADNQKLVLVLTASSTGSRTTQATVIIMLERGVSSVNFDKVLYEGIIQSGTVQHETIGVSGYEGANINIVGEYASLFGASVSDGTAVIRATGPLTLPANVRHVILELRLADSGAVLVLQVSTTESPTLPTVAFESSSYALRVELGQTGLVGQVRASADNGEPVAYSLRVDNEHLRARISINNAGELRVSALVNSGVYSFQAVATTAFSEAIGLATDEQIAYLMVHLSVEATTVCDKDVTTAPLIVIDRDEEIPLKDLVLNPTQHAGCRYVMTNRWPADQSWLYVDDTGLHSTAIDREHPSIAFMALSQVQVELVLTCDSDAKRTKRSTDKRLDWLGPYDYGTNRWILGETLAFNSRRTIVNLIVNDINDNAPIFVGKESEPIVVGYPVPELEDVVLPRSLAELQATDADVGFNAELIYWSSEPVLAVSPTTGFVHVRNDQRLEQDMMLTVHVTDQLGAGLQGSISLLVKLLDSDNIAVITVRDAFLEDESRVLGNISNSIGYEVRALRSVVVSGADEAPSSRTKREVTSEGATLTVYVYGLVQKVPVSVEKLKTDINDAVIGTINIANIESLQDHIDSHLGGGSNTGLLVAIIVLGVLLFLLIVAIIVWFVVRRIKNRNYEQFSDENSLASQSVSPGQPKTIEGAEVGRPRLNLEELKRSEKRLQDMLNAPIEEITIDPGTSNRESINSVIKIPQPDPLPPIVIQDKLKDVEESDDDEFGERKKTRRKSVVTFNENVEKIIHVNEEAEPPADSNLEVYKF